MAPTTSNFHSMLAKGDCVDFNSILLAYSLLGLLLELAGSLDDSPAVSGTKSEMFSNAHSIPSGGTTGTHLEIL